MASRRVRKRMYAVSKEGIGIIAGTMSYSRRGAIEHFTPLGNWQQYKREGYRTVMAKVEIIHRTVQ